jgi:beta-lactamase regulating signal transducer with metallopeptidase domain
MIYFMITSSFLIVLMLFVRSVFRKKLSPGIIYALWLIPLLRLMIPFGFVEVPVFGAMAELLNPSFAIAREIEMEAVESDYEKTDIFNEHVPMEENKQEHNGIKVYDSVLEMEPVGDGSLDTTEAVSVGQVNDHKTNIKQIGVTVWISGAVLLSVYVIVLNCRLQKKVNELEVIEQADGCDILLSREVKTPCLVGVRNPRILIPETVLKDRKLYEYAIRHELAHFHQKDHFWNVIRIFMCVVYWWNPFVWYGAKCAAEDAELACDERVLKNKTAQERKDYGYALLSMMENAQNSPLCMATSYFGGKNTTKQRIESIARKATTKKYVLIPVILLLVVFCAVGCLYPSNESNTKTDDLIQSETEELTDNEAKDEYPEMLSIDEYNETYSKREFSTEPEENKVCLAVMPDGISKAGGDYRYIIPEDQIKWTDQYKQARSLATNGGWKDGEHSTGIWIVLNNEWTCITEQGMIFDFDKRVEKEQIEEFYNLCIEEAKKFGTGTPINPVNFPEIISATLNYNGACTVTDANVLKDLRKMIFTSKEIRGGSSCPFTAALVLEIKDGIYETIYLATDSCSAWLTDGVYYEYFGCDGIEELSEIFERYGAKIDAEDTILEIENNQANISLKGNTLGAIELIKEAEERVRAGYQEATLTYVDNAEVRWDYYTDNPWASNAERDALAQAALKELYTLTGYQVEECTYTTDGRSRFIFGKSAEYIKKNIAFYSRDYGFWLCGDNVPFIGFMNARKVHYSDVQQLDSPFDNDKIKGLEQVSQWFLERSGLYQGEMITGYEEINLDDTVYTHMRMNFDGGYYIVVMDEKIESIHNVMGPYME